MPVMGVHDGVSSAACDERPVHRESGHEGDGQSDRKAAPEEDVAELGLERAGVTVASVSSRNV